MRLTVRLPAQVFFDEEVLRIRAEAENGWFGIRPRHIDFVTALLPGVLRFQRAGRDEEEYLAIDHGILVKCGREVSVSTRNAAHGTSLESLKEHIEGQLTERQEREKQAHALEARLEADLVRGLLEAEKNG